MFRFNSKFPQTISDENVEATGAPSHIACQKSAHDLSQLSDERTVSVAIPAVTPEKPSVIIFDEPLVYDDTTQRDNNANPLDVSLHTVSSELSVDMNLVFDAAAEEYEDHDLSFRVSQLESSDLQANNTINIIPDDTPEVVNDDLAIQNLASHDFETMVSVSQQLLKADDDEDATMGQRDTPMPVSSLVHNKGKIVGAMLLVGMVAQGIYFCMPMSRNEEASSSFVIHEDETTFTVGNTTYKKEALTMDVPLSIGTLLHLVLFGIATKIILWRWKSSGACLATGKANIVTSGSSSNIEEDSSDHDSVPSLIPVPLDVDDIALSNYNLSKCQELRPTKRQAGLKKVERMYSSAYRAELQSMTVAQLRQQLKTFNLKQGGRKEELIQRLIEAGIEGLKF
jgi:hypothetical protein